MPPVIGDSSTNDAAVTGRNSSTGQGLLATSEASEGVHGETKSNRFAGVAGFNNATTFAEGLNATGVFGKTQIGEGVHGETSSNRFAGVAGFNNATNAAEGLLATGVFGKTQVGEGVHGETSSDRFAGVAGRNLNRDGTGAGVFGESLGRGAGIAGKGATAGFFDGDLEVTRNVRVRGDIVLPGADCAEDFDISGTDEIEPGTVVVLDANGGVATTCEPYDRKVAGVISGAGGLRPGLTLDRRTRQPGRSPVALMGKVYCKVDANHGAIAIGDLLTTSPTRGHAMKASDRARAFGSIIGKALLPLPEGRTLLPILIALQ
jgi:hypothetical protein